MVLSAYGVYSETTFLKIVMLMSQLQFVRSSLSVAIIVICSLFSHGLFAANYTAEVQGLNGKKIVQNLSFSKDNRRLLAGDTLTFAVEPVLTFNVLSNTLNKDGSRSVTAKSDKGTRLLMSVDANNVAVYGSIVGADINYSISTDKKNGTVLIDQAHVEFPEVDLSNDAMVPPTMRSDEPGINQISAIQRTQLLNSQNQTSGQSNISILFLYSKEFGQGFASPTTRINDLLNYTNQALSDSDIGITFTVASALQVNFSNNLSTSQILTQVTNGTGAFDTVASLRNQVGADMVAVLSFASGFSANGVAWVNGDNPNFAFSSTRLSPGCCNSVFAHELGHNLGSGHERAAVNNPGDPCDSFNFTGYSCGHGNAGRNWGTIMSRLNSDNAGNVFSNPLSSDCRGEPCGIPEGQVNSADNTRSFNMSRLLVANFREDPVISVPSPSGPRNTDAKNLPAIFSILLDED